MKKKILIIEDDLSHWTYIKSMFSDDDDFSCIPTEINEFNKIRDEVNNLYSPKDDVSDNAKNYLINKIKNVDLLLLDYELDDSNKTINCINLYKELNLNVKALIYTKYKSSKFDTILKEIKSHSYNDRMKAIQKPEDLKKVYELNKTIEYLKSTIKEVINNNEELLNYDSSK